MATTGKDTHTLKDTHARTPLAPMTDPTVPLTHVIALMLAIEGEGLLRGRFTWSLTLTDRASGYSYDVPVVEGEDNAP